MGVLACKHGSNHAPDKVAFGKSRRLASPDEHQSGLRPCRFNDMKQLLAILFTLNLCVATAARGQDREALVADLEQKLSQAKNSIAALQKTMEELTGEMQSLRLAAATSPAAIAPAESGKPAEKVVQRIPRSRRRARRACGRRPTA